MLVFISDLHLRPGARSQFSRTGQFARFWQRIDHSRRGEPAKLCFVGDLFDLVRAPDWLKTELRPYHEPSTALAQHVERLIERTAHTEDAFLSAIRAKVSEGAVEVQYIVGNHDRLLQHAPSARAEVRRALGMPPSEEPFPTEARFPEYGVLAYHGHVLDTLCFDASGAAPLSDMIAPELIVRFPDEIRRVFGFDHPHLDDIDDVRPLVAVPTWVRALARSEQRIGPGMTRLWARLIEEFLENPHVRQWFKDKHRSFKLDFAQKVKLLLALSAKRGLREDAKFAALQEVLFRILDVKYARAAYKALEKPENKGLRYVVNGHTHFAGMTPLGMVGGKPACYFNIGTWRTVHQLGRVGKSEPAFLPYDAMAYLAFFSKSEQRRREFEWWQGASAVVDVEDEGGGELKSVG